MSTVEVIAQPGRQLCLRFTALLVHGVAYSGTLHTKDYGEGKQIPVRDEHGRDHTALWARRADGRWPDDPTPAGKRGLRIELGRLANEWAEANPGAFDAADAEGWQQDLARLDSEISRLEVELKTKRAERARHFQRRSK